MENSKEIEQLGQKTSIDEVAQDIQTKSVRRYVAEFVRCAVGVDQRSDRLRGIFRRAGSKFASSFVSPKRVEARASRGA